MASAISANKAELLAIANSVASEKMIDKAIVIEAMEEAIQKSARNRYGAENDIRAKLDPLTGDLRLWRVVEVVEEVEDYFKQIDLKAAEKLQDDAKVGDFIVDPLPPVDLGRIDAQSAKQVIFQKVRDAERERQYEEFKDRAGEVITGVIKSVEFGHVIVNLGRAEGVIRRDQQIPREAARVGERVRALITKVERNNRGPQIFLSRAHPDFMRKLFAQEVPEIYDGIIEIKAAARDPGSRAKIGVISHDSSIDPVGACVGMKGSRVQAVVQELQGEKIDIIPWSEDTATSVTGVTGIETLSQSADYDQFLPNLNINLEVTDDIVLRAAFSKTISRADYGSLQGGTTINTGGSLSGYSGNSGNPGLEPLESINYDLSAER